MTPPDRRAPSRAPRRPGPGRPTSGRSWPRPRGRRARIAMVAVVAALVALGLAAWRFVVPAGAPARTPRGTRRPGTADLPGRLVDQRQPVRRRPQADDRRRPDPRGRNAAQAVVYATITCFPSGAADAVTRSADAATAAGQTVTARDDLGDRRSAPTDPSSATFLQLRHGDVVVYLAASGDATPSRGRRARLGVRQGARRRRRRGRGRHARPRRLGRAVGRRRVPSGAAEETVEPRPRPTSRRRSRPRSATSRWPSDSATGADVLGDDPGARAVAAALRAAGHQPEDLLVAYA